MIILKLIRLSSFDKYKDLVNTAKTGSGVGGTER